MWKLYREAYFVDDAMDYGGSGLDVIRKVRHKPHSHDWGRKPRWRMIRRDAKRMVANERKNTRHRNISDHGLYVGVWRW